jgi:membrane-bound metal-dependent hydrolase YbcI (DUF457 family)
MFALGHFALGYLSGKATSKLAKTKINLPLLLAISVIPDVDLLLRGLMNHRGLTHSIFTISILAIPFFVMYRKTALPYFFALLSHVFIGDLFTGGVEFLWPFTKESIGLLNFQVNSPAITYTELALFIVSLALMYKLKDLQTLFKAGNHNLFLIIPFGAVLGPLLVFSRSIDPISPLLIVPSLFWMVIFAYSMLIDLRVKLSLG